MSHAMEGKKMEREARDETENIAPVPGHNNGNNYLKNLWDWIRK